MALLRAATGTPCEISGAAYLPPLAAGRSAVEALRRHARGTAAIRLEGFGPSIAYRSGELERALAAPGIEFAALEGEDSRTLWREVRDVALLHPGAAAVAPVGAAIGRRRPRRLDRGADQRAAVRLGGRADLAGPEGELGAARRPPCARPWPAAAATPPWCGRRRGCGGRSTCSSRSRRRCAALTERVKRSFDPEGVLNPGRMYAGI